MYLHLPGCKPTMISITAGIRPLCVCHACVKLPEYPISPGLLLRLRVGCFAILAIAAAWSVALIP